MLSSLESVIPTISFYEPIDGFSGNNGIIGGGEGGGEGVFGSNSSIFNRLKFYCQSDFYDSFGGRSGGDS